MNKRLIIYVVLLSLCLSSCASEEQIVERVRQTLTALPSSTPFPTYTQYPSQTSYPTFTQTPTITITPTKGYDGWVYIGLKINLEHEIDDLFLDPQNSTIMYVQIVYTHPNGGPRVYKSVDGGLNWQAIDNNIPGNYLRLLAIDPMTPSTLYAEAGENGVYKTNDGGGIWFPSNNDLTKTWIKDLQINPQNPRILYLLTTNHFFRSEDGGGTWRRLDFGLPSSYWTDFLLDPFSPSTIYAVHITGFAWEFALYKSINEGSNWAFVSEENKLSYFGKIYINSEKSTILFLVTNSGLLKSNDGGMNWEMVFSMKSNSYCTTLVADEKATYIGTEKSGVFKSQDGGSTWKYLGLKGIYINSLKIDPQKPGRIYAATDKGLLYMEQSNQ